MGARVFLWVVARGAARVPALNRKYKIKERLDGPWISCAVLRTKPHLWLHGASLGECRMLLAVAHALKEDWSFCPEILLTTQKAEVVELLKKNAEGCCDVALAPADLSVTLRKFVAEVDPVALVLGENELWPGYVSFMKSTCRKVALVSGRVKNVAPGVRLDDLGFVTMQADGGNWKLLDWARESVGRLAVLKPVAKGLWIDVVFVSFHKEEIPALLKLAGTAVDAGMSVVVVPRRLEETEIFRNALLSHEPLDGRVLEWPSVQKKTVTIVSRFGVVPEILKRCDVSVVGGSFVERPGIHDFWEPLRAGVKTFVGPYSRGAEEAVAMLVERGALVRVSGDSVRDGWWTTAPDSYAAQICLQEEREKILHSYGRLLEFLSGNQ